MTATTRIFLALALAGVAPTACALDKDEADKGLVDDSTPPSGAPDSQGIGKADGSDRIIEVALESEHPYDDDMDQVYRLDLNDALPGCAQRVRVHFAALRVERDYDYIYVSGDVDEQYQRFTGRRDDTWTSWVFLDGADRGVDVRLETDYSVTDHGFVIDAVEWDGSPICPAVVWPACAAGEVDLNTPPADCGCPRQPLCASVGAVEIQANRFRGFDNQGKRTRGTAAFTLAPGPADGLEETRVGSVDATALAAVIRAAAAAGLWESAGYDIGDWSGYSVYFSLKFDDMEVVFRAKEGMHQPAVQAVIDQFNALFTCGAAADPLDCGTGYTCRDSACVLEVECLCIDIYEPVCGEDMRTYSNDCVAGCASMPVRHAGVCGIAGDTCGTIMGLGCTDGFKCRYQDSGLGIPYPDEGGACVVETYCDAPVDCNGLPHIAVPGSWSCASHSCAWQAGPAWQGVTGFRFETWHPYGNRANLWKQLYLPAGAVTMRLTKLGTGGFHLESGYDFLEVWTWQNGAWRQVKRYTGGNGPQPGDEFPGRYHYLHFVSDVSVTDHGFAVGAEYRNY